MFQWVVSLVHFYPCSTSRISPGKSMTTQTGLWPMKKSLTSCLRFMGVICRQRNRARSLELWSYSKSIIHLHKEAVATAMREWRGDQTASEDFRLLAPL